MLVTVRQLLRHAAEHGYALGAFNTVNLEMTLGIARAAVACQSPVIVQVTETTIDYAGLKPITHVVETVAKNAAGDVPIALHFDHGQSFRSIAECIHAGFSSIMIDASDLPFDENVTLTKQAVDYAHAFDALAQGEVGSLKPADTAGGTRHRPVTLTEPETAERFVRATHVDTLAVAVGNVYGTLPAGTTAPPLDLERLSEIHRRLPKTPLALHGATGLSAETIRSAIERGVRIMNIVTEVEEVFTQSLRASLSSGPGETDPRVLLEPAISAVAELVRAKLTSFGSAGAGKDFPAGVD